MPWYRAYGSESRLASVRARPVTPARLKTRGKPAPKKRRLLHRSVEGELDHPDGLVVLRMEPSKELQSGSAVERTRVRAHENLREVVATILVRIIVLLRPVSGDARLRENPPSGARTPRPSPRPSTGPYRRDRSSPPRHRVHEASESASSRSCRSPPGRNARDGCLRNFLSSPKPSTLPNPVSPRQPETAPGGGREFTGAKRGRIFLF